MVTEKARRERPESKGVLPFLAILPQFTDPTADWPFSGQILLLRLVHVASRAVVYLAVCFGMANPHDIEDLRRTGLDVIIVPGS